MPIFPRYLPVLASLMFSSLTPLISAEATSTQAKSPHAIRNAFEPFTGCIRRSKVRMRAQADVNSSIVSELTQGSLIAVVGEHDDFYAVRPQESMQVYVYRTYVLNQTVDAARINVRLGPSMDAPIIGQMQKGDRIEGQISKENDQWIAINLPDTISLYIAKEFIEKVGPPSYLSNVRARREEAAEWIRLSELSAQKALDHPAYHPAEELDLAQAYGYLNRVHAQCKEFPDLINRAEQARNAIEEKVKQKQLYARLHPQPIVTPPMPNHPPLPAIPRSMPETMSYWVPHEQILFEDWRKQHPEESITAFYTAQESTAQPLKGVIQPYTRSIQNKPGNFLLIDPVNGHPTAFLYSTQVDLQEHAGKTLSLLAAPRANHNFAFPAFFVLSIL